MSLSDIVKKRYSVRSFKEMPVEKEKIIQVLESARYAPSAVNYQPWHFIVVTEEDIKKKISETYSRTWFKHAPVIIAACGDHNKSWKRKDGKDHCDIDVAIAVDHMTLTATDLGLGTCWVCAFDSKKCHEVLNLPENLEVIALLPMGYPVEEFPKDKKRNDIKDMVSWEKYGEEINK